jgi:hypothetical protein
MTRSGGRGAGQEHRPGGGRGPAAVRVLQAVRPYPPIDPGGTRLVPVGGDAPGSHPLRPATSRNLVNFRCSLSERALSLSRLP